MLFSFFMQSYFVKSKIVHRYVFFLSIVSFLFSSFLSCLYYLNIAQGGHLLWVCWALSVTLLIYSFSQPCFYKKLFDGLLSKSNITILIFVIVLFWISHLWNFPTAPWNQNGLFDDAAWDIYFAKNHIFNDFPFQPAFFDTVGYISREVVFHYYISIAFKLFGYNLLVFNIFLMFLGFITVLFTTLLIQKMFKNIVITLLSALIINFFPLHYMHIFMGHRYAIAAPLMVISLYFLYTSFVKTSYIRATASSFFAALCLGSSIMGKQYILGLILSIPLAWLIGKGKISKKHLSVGIVWLIGFIVSASPMLVYIVFNYPQYTGRERGLLQEFISRYQNGGFLALKPYADQIAEIFFTQNSFRRQFLPDFYAIPFTYYALILPGIIITLYKKRFEIVLLTLIPIVAAILSGAYDFRILLAVPLWVICIAFSIDYAWTYVQQKNIFMRVVTVSIIGMLVGMGLISSVVYIWNVSKNPNHLYLLPHKDVAVSRLVQDIVAGEAKPTINMKWNEFNRKEVNSYYDTLVSPDSSYAIMHLYLQDFDDKKVLSFIDQGIQQLKTPSEVFYDNIEAIQLHKENGKDLKLIWEVSNKSTEAIGFFKKYKKYGSEKIISEISDGEPFSIYILAINNENIKKLKKDIAQDLGALNQ